jgi:hypothetical protein
VQVSNLKESLLSAMGMGGISAVKSRLSPLFIEASLGFRTLTLETAEDGESLSVTNFCESICEPAFSVTVVLRDPIKTSPVVAGSGTTTKAPGSLNPVMREALITCPVGSASGIGGFEPANETGRVWPSESMGRDTEKLFRQGPRENHGLGKPWTKSLKVGPNGICKVCFTL